MADEPELAIVALRAEIDKLSRAEFMLLRNVGRLVHEKIEAAAIIKELVKAAERGLEAAIECANECGQKGDAFGNYMKDIHFIEAALSRAGANNDPSK